MNLPAFRCALTFFSAANAIHLGSLVAAHGYFFPITDHVLTLRDDNTFYRFQTPYFWPSNCWEPENTDYGKSDICYWHFLKGSKNYFFNGKYKIVEQLIDQLSMNHVAKHMSEIIMEL